MPPLPNTPSWRGAQLKHKDNFTFTFKEITQMGIVASDRNTSFSFMRPPVTPMRAYNKASAKLKTNVWIKIATIRPELDRSL